MALSKFNKKILLNNKCAIHFKKARLYTCEEIEIKDVFVKIQADELRYIAIDNVKSIEVKDGVYRVQVVYNSIVVGKVINIDEKFITIEIDDEMTSHKYHNLIPIRSIKGIKSYSND